MVVGEVLAAPVSPAPAPARANGVVRSGVTPPPGHDGEMDTETVGDA